MVQRTLQLERFLETLQSRWPKPVPKEVSQLFSQVGKCLKDLKQKPEKVSKKYFSFVELIHQVLKTHDFLFLSRHLTYHVVTTADLPEAFGSKDEALAVLTELLGVMAKRSGFGSRIEIEVKKTALREGPAIEVKFVCTAKVLSEMDRQQLLEQFYGKASGKEGGGGLVYAKESLRKAGGQLWLEFPGETQLALALNWPSFDTFKPRLVAVGAYKFDVFITDYAKIRQRFGINRSKKLVALVEEFIKSLVRHPVDMVISFPNQGAITAIYESQEGAASSVATRISQRLKKESFRLGRKSVAPKFRYQLTLLN